MKLGIYERIINQRFREKLNSLDKQYFYVGNVVI